MNESLKAFESLHAWLDLKAGFLSEIKIMWTPIDILILNKQDHAEKILFSLLSPCSRLE